MCEYLVKNIYCACELLWVFSTQVIKEEKGNDAYSLLQVSKKEESISHPLYARLLRHCTGHVCNETFTATIVFIFKKNRGEIPPPNMTSLHWQIMCSAPLQKMAEFFFFLQWGGEAEKMCRDLRTSKQIIYWHSWLSSCLGEWNFV